MNAYAPKCKVTGNAPYVRVSRSWGRTNYGIVYATTLAEAKAQYGWTRDRHTSITVRRARVEDGPLAPLDWCGCPDDHRESA